MPIRSTSYAGSSAAGRSKSPSLRFVVIWGWKANGNGPIPPSPAPHRCCWRCSPSWANDLQRERPLLTRTASWYPKKLPTFADALAAVRTELWRGQGFRMSRQPKDVADIHPDTLNRLIDLACYAA